jgi:hypothetical protein
MPIPIIASDMTITSTSTVSHVGMRFAGWVIACALRCHVMYRKRASGYERVHMSAAIITGMAFRLRSGWLRDTAIRRRLSPVASLAWTAALLRAWLAAHSLF